MILKCPKEEYKEWAVSLTETITSEYLGAIQEVSQRGLQSMMEDGLFKDPKQMMVLNPWFVVRGRFEMFVEHMIKLQMEQAGKEYDNVRARTNGDQD